MALPKTYNSMSVSFVRSKPSDCYYDILNNNIGIQNYTLFSKLIQ